MKKKGSAIQNVVTTFLGIIVIAFVVIVGSLLISQGRKEACTVNGSAGYGTFNNQTCTDATTMQTNFTGVVNWTNIIFIAMLAVIVIGVVIGVAVVANRPI